jgi:hypothetical protein
MNVGIDILNTRMDILNGEYISLKYGDKFS